jgi:hypothetical protein
MLRKTIVRGLLAVAAVLVAGVVWLALMRPSSDRPWIPDHAVMPRVAFQENLVSIENVRDFQEDEGGEVRRAYRTWQLDLDRVESLWYVLAVFHEDDWRGPAHSMFSFGFADGRYLVVSVEARKEVGESYSIWQGLRNKYEVIYVLGTEQDLVLTRAVHRPDDVYLYPVKASPARIRDLLTSLLVKADDLNRHPEFYNTLTNNCTTKLRDHVNEVEPGLIPVSWKVQLPGFSDELARDLGLIDASLPIDEARRRYHINAAARQARDAPDFSARIRAGIGGP